jgi:flagellar basal-body rod protein FlgC
MNFDSFDISASALSAQRIKMDTIASNLANINTTRNPDGTPGTYRRKEAVFASIYDEELNKDGNENDTSSGGVKSNDKALQGGVSENDGMISGGVKVQEIAEDFDTPLRKVYNPSHPDADADGYVSFPNVNLVSEMVDMMSASRAYEANVTAIKAEKNMLSSAMKI